MCEKQKGHLATFPSWGKKNKTKTLFNQADVVSMYYTVRENGCLLLLTLEIAPDG